MTDGGVSAADAPPLLQIEDLSVSFGRGASAVEVVNSASITVEIGQTVGLVGESGSGKSVTGLAAMGLLPRLGGAITGGSLRLAGKEMTTAPESEWRKVRGVRVAMIFQQPTRSLDPVFSIGEQISESIRYHLKMSRRDARDRTLDLLRLVGIQEPAKRYRDYAHEFSGGMCQRVMIAMALACDPELLIADEPTTALDVQVQTQILELLADLVSRRKMAMLYISHDLATVSSSCDKVAVMYAGQAVETGGTLDVLFSPQHPYSAGLVQCVPRAGAGRARLKVIEGTVPQPLSMPAGCRFAPRCPHAETERCSSDSIPLVGDARARSVRCVRHRELHLEGL